MGQMELIFEWDGHTVHKKTSGFSGADCVKKTKFIEEALGKAEERTFTSEFYEEHNEEEHEQQRERN